MSQDKACLSERLVKDLISEYFRRINNEQTSTVLREFINTLYAQGYAAGRAAKATVQDSDIHEARLYRHARDEMSPQTVYDIWCEANEYEDIDAAIEKDMLAAAHKEPT